MHSVSSPDDLGTRSLEAAATNLTFLLRPLAISTYFLAHMPIEIPRRKSLASMIAASIRKEIEAGSWQDFLPTERRLGEMFQVSRPTLRVALHLLANEKLIEIIPGQGTRLLNRSRGKPVPTSRLIAVIAHRPVPELGLTYQGVAEMRTHLAEQGFETEVVLCQSHGSTAQRHVENYLKKRSVFCCVLLSVNEQMQRWFTTHSIPALVIGSCHPNVRLPSLDIDNRSVCRHAVGVFINHGHRRLELLIPDSGLAGDIVSEQGFREGIEKRMDPRAIDGRITRHNGTTSDIIKKMDKLLKSSTPPTALMMANADEAFIGIMYLLNHGHSVPNTVSLISRDHSRIFEIVNPSITHYKPELGAFEHRLSRLMVKMVGQGYLAPEANLIVPKFFPGDTVKTV